MASERTRLPAAPAQAFGVGPQGDRGGGDRRPGEPRAAHSTACGARRSRHGDRDLPAALSRAVPAGSFRALAQGTQFTNRNARSYRVAQAPRAAAGTKPAAKV